MKPTKRKITIIISLLLALTVFVGAYDYAALGTENPSEEITLSENDSAEAEATTMVKRFSKKIIAVTTGSIFDQYVNNYLPESYLEYINTSTDMALALAEGKIDGFIADEPIARLLEKKYDDFYTAWVLEEASYGYIFPKGTEKTKVIRAQLNEFLIGAKASGLLSSIDKTWFGDDEELKTVDYDHFTGENGTLNLAVCSDVGAPFVYMKDGKLVGYDIDIAARFCKAYGYALNVVDTNVSGLMASVSGGRCDFGASTIAITEERKEIYDFSEPNYDGGIVLVTRDRQMKDTPAITDPELLEKLEGLNVGIITGSVYDVLGEKYLPKSTIVHFNSAADLPIALDTGKIDAFYTDHPLAVQLSKGHDDFSIYAVTNTDNYAYMFPKDSARSDKIRAELNGFLQKIKENGTLNDIKDIWFGDDESLKVVNIKNLTGENGTIKMAISTVAGDPFCYVKDGQFVGYDLDIVARFCADYGYKLEFSDSNFSGLLECVMSGRCDFGGSCITMTDERKESANFSDPNYYGGAVIIVKGDTIATRVIEEKSAIAQFFDGIAESFERTFIREDRWQLFLSGIGTTLFITFASMVFGTGIGFGIYLIYRKEKKGFKLFINVISDVLGKTPVVVILMILYYIVFVETDIDGAWVSIVGFTLLFSLTVNGLMKSAVGAVDKGQMEAARALGYTDTKAFMKIILPQALKHFLPLYKNEIVTLIKATAIVGYITVQDLTKVGDIVRSRTYEPFFPLIAGAIIYYLLAEFLIFVVKGIEVQADYKNRKKKEILEGIDVE